MNNCDVAIIGAGPYGLSIAAHLKARGVNFRIFGGPMEFWQKHMPQGMRLKSEGFASFLYDPAATFTLETYCQQQGLPYAPIGNPVPLETFTAYGLEFQKRFVPEVEDQRVVSLRRSAHGFEVTLNSGEGLEARRIVVAVGLSYYDHLPRELAEPLGERVSHSSEHSGLERFRGQDVIVIGAGASALDLAALLREAGASVQLVARKGSIRFNDPCQLPRPVMDQLRHPTTGLGPGWRSLLYIKAPHLFRRLPEEMRLKIVRQHLGPAPGWFIKDQVLGKVPFNLGVEISKALLRNGRASLELTESNGTRRTLEADHVIAATGYKVDVRRVEFLDAAMLPAIKTTDRAPALSPHFESSVRGLYFVGTSAANTFGPLMRFAYGARFAAQRVSAHLAKTSGARRRVTPPQETGAVVDRNMRLQVEDGNAE
jgi:cation diffusion facilitator CzcD-associated flavoprotein CzcO